MTLNAFQFPLNITELCYKDMKSVSTIDIKQFRLRDPQHLSSHIAWSITWIEDEACNKFHWFPHLQ